MGNFRKYGATSDGSIAPTPIVYNQVPVSEILSYPNKGFGFYSDMQIAEADGRTTLAQGVSMPWVVTSTEAAGTAASSIINAHTTGGGAIYDLLDTDNKGIQTQAGEAFTPAAGQKIVMGCSAEVTTVASIDFFMGICTTDTSIGAGRPDDAIGFSIADGAGTLLYNVSKTGSTAAATALTTTTAAVDATAVQLEIVVNGLTSVEFWVNGVQKAEITANIPTVTMAFSLAALNGASAAQQVLFRNSYCWQYTD